MFEPNLSGNINILPNFGCVGSGLENENWDLQKKRVRFRDLGKSFQMRLLLFLNLIFWTCHWCGRERATPTLDLILLQPRSLPRSKLTLALRKREERVESGNTMGIVCEYHELSEKGGRQCPTHFSADIQHVVQASLIYCNVKKKSASLWLNFRT